MSILDSIDKCNFLEGQKDEALIKLQITNRLMEEQLYEYYSRCVKLRTPQLYEEWLQSFPKEQQFVADGFSKKGYEKGKTCIPFLRFVGEMSDLVFPVAHGEE